MFCTILSNLGLAKLDSSNASSGVPLLATKIKVYRDLLTVSTGSRVACITTLLFLMLECGAGACTYVYVGTYVLHGTFYYFDIEYHLSQAVLELGNTSSPTCCNYKSVPPCPALWSDGVLKLELGKKRHSFHSLFSFLLLSFFRSLFLSFFPSFSSFMPFFLFIMVVMKKNCSKNKQGLYH